MKREELEKIGVPKEQIDEIMKINGADIEAEKLKTGVAVTERDGFKKTLDNTNIELKKFDGLDLEAQKKILTDLNIKYDTDTKELSDKLLKQDSDHKSSKFMDGYEFTSELAKKAALNDLQSQGFKIDGETILGAKDYMEKMKVDSPTAFVVKDENNNDPPPSWGNKTNVNNEATTPVYNFPK